MEITPLAPPSVQLVPAKEYNGAPIGTSYDVRAYVGKLIQADPIIHNGDYCLNYESCGRLIIISAIRSEITFAPFQ